MVTYTGLLLFIVCLGVILMLSAVFAMAETSLMSVNRFRIHHRAKKGSRTAQQIQELIRRPDRPLGAILIADNLLDIALGSVTTYFITTTVGGSRRGVFHVTATVLVAILIITFGKILPKTIAAANAEAVVGSLVAPLSVFMFLLHPLVRMTTALSNAFARLIHVPVEIGPFPHMLTGEELRSMLSEEQQHLGLGKEKQAMLHDVFLFGDKRMREVMISRVDVTAIDINASWEEVLKTIQASGYSRIPVYREQFDNIIGILYARDVLPLLMENRRPASWPLELEKILHPAHYVPDSAKIEIVLRQLQRLHIHMAIVVDEFGGLEGIVTLEDIIEEIIGEIQDEYDREVDAIKKVGPDTYLVEGNLAIREVNKELGLGIPETHYYTTLAGLLLTLTGRLLREGDTVQFRHATFDIEKVDNHKIVSVRVRIKKEPLIKSR